MSKKNEYAKIFGGKKSSTGKMHVNKVKKSKRQYDIFMNDVSKKKKKKKKKSKSAEKLVTDKLSDLFGEKKKSIGELEEILVVEKQKITENLSVKDMIDAIVEEPTFRGLFIAEILSAGESAIAYMTITATDNGIIESQTGRDLSEFIEEEMMDSTLVKNIYSVDIDRLINMIRLFY